jgi:hypothetical protein
MSDLFWDGNLTPKLEFVPLKSRPFFYAFTCIVEPAGLARFFSPSIFTHGAYS